MPNTLAKCGQAGALTCPMQFRIWAPKLGPMPQVAFFKFLVELSKAPPPWLRMVGKRGTFFAPLDPRRPPSTSLPKLLKKCAKTPEP